MSASTSYNSYLPALQAAQIGYVANKLGVGSSGRVYYVDLIRGSSSNDGSSWDSAFAQVNEAITASEVYRLAQTNVYVRNTIFVQGCANTCYDALTAFPNYTDVIGIGGTSQGDQTGTVVIGTYTTTNGTTTAEMRGTNWYNIQFRGGGSGTGRAFLALKVLRCEFIDCHFRPSAAAAAFEIYTGGTGAGNVFYNCRIGYTIDSATYGMYINETNNWDTCLIDHCSIFGSTAAYYTNAYLQDSTVVRDCLIFGGVLAIDDNSTESNVSGQARYIGNYCYGSANTTTGTIITITNNPTKVCCGNFENTNGTCHMYPLVITT